MSGRNRKSEDFARNVWTKSKISRLRAQCLDEIENQQTSRAMSARNQKSLNFGRNVRTKSKISEHSTLSFSALEMHLPLVQAAGPILFQEAGKSAICEEASVGLTGSAVIALIFRIHNTLDG